MLISLKNHPFPVEAFFEISIVLTFAFPKDELIRFLPECFKLDTYDDKWGFLAVALVKTKDLKPKGFPNIFSNNFILVGYRLFVRYTNNVGKSLRGLYILKSETNKQKMELTSKLFTRYNFSTTDITISENIDELNITSKKSDLLIQIKCNTESPELPKTSPFANYKDARRFVGPLPYTFTWLQNSKQVLIVEGLRESWTAKPVEVLSYNIPFINSIDLNHELLANAFIIRDISYHWKKGRLENWSA